MKEYPRVIFKVAVPNDIMKIGEFFKLSKEYMTRLKSSYIPVKDIHHENDHLCVIDDILISDLMEYSQDHPLRVEYDGYIHSYGEDIVNMWIVSDERLKLKLSNICSYFINEYLFSSMNTDVVIINFQRRADDGFESKIINILYQVIQENFNIVKQNLRGNNNSIYVSKRS